jgi:ATP synthase protein I
MTPDEERERRMRSWRTMALLSTAGLTLALSIGIGIGIGILLDRWLHTRGILVIVGLLFGVAAGFKELITLVMRAGREQEEEERRIRSEQQHPDEGNE